MLVWGFLICPIYYAVPEITSLSRQALLYHKVTPQATPLNFHFTSLYKSPEADLEDSGNGSFTLTIQLPVPGMFTCPTKASGCLYRVPGSQQTQVIAHFPHLPLVAPLSPPQLIIPENFQLLHPSRMDAPHMLTLPRIPHGDCPRCNAPAPEHLFP